MQSITNECANCQKTCLLAQVLLVRSVSMGADSSYLESVLFEGKKGGASKLLDSLDGIELRISEMDGKKLISSQKYISLFRRKRTGVLTDKILERGPTDDIYVCVMPRSRAETYYRVENDRIVRMKADFELPSSYRRAGPSVRQMERFLSDEPTERRLNLDFDRRRMRPSPFSSMYIQSVSTIGFFISSIGLENYLTPSLLTDSLTALPLIFADVLAYVGISTYALPLLTKSVKQSADKLRESAKSAGVNFKRMFIMPSREENAMTLPDNSIILTSGIVEAQSPEELMGTIFHELGHVKKRHFVKNISIAAGYLLTSLVASSIAGATTQTLLPAFIGATAAYIASIRSVQRKFEYDADKFADLNGYGHGLVYGLAKITGKLDFYRKGSHPSTYNRIKKLGFRPENVMSDIGIHREDVSDRVDIDITTVEEGRDNQ